MCFFYVLSYTPLEHVAHKLSTLNVKINQADFIVWIVFLPSNFMEETRSNPEVLNAST